VYIDGGDVTHGSASMRVSRDDQSKRRESCRGFAAGIGDNRFEKSLVENKLLLHGATQNGRFLA
jgi:hypothetical protein